MVTLRNGDKQETLDVFLLLRVDLPVIVVITAQRYFTLNTEKNQTMSYFFSLGKYIIKFRVETGWSGTKPTKTLANQEVILTVYSPFTSEYSLLDWGIKQTAPSTPPAPQQI